MAKQKSKVPARTPIRVLPVVYELKLTAADDGSLYGLIGRLRSDLAYLLRTDPRYAAHAYHADNLATLADLTLQVQPDGTVLARATAYLPITEPTNER